MSLDSDEPMIISKPESVPAENNNNKRKAIEQVKEELIEITVEPAHMCDFIIKYKNVVIHTHKVILLMYSKFFQAVMEDKECKEVTIEPKINNLNGKKITPEAFGSFFRRLAFIKISMTDNLSCRCDDIYLANYFTVDHYIREAIEEYERAINGIQEYGTTTAVTINNLKIVMEYLSFRYHYKWNSLEPRMQSLWLFKFTIKNFYYMLGNAEQMDEVWKLFPDGLTKQLSVEYALDRHSFDKDTTAFIRNKLVQES